jgi:hypothetical protein
VFVSGGSASGMMPSDGSGSGSDPRSCLSQSRARGAAERHAAAEACEACETHRGAIQRSPAAASAEWAAAAAGTGTATACAAATDPRSRSGGTLRRPARRGRACAQPPPRPPAAARCRCRCHRWWHRRHPARPAAAAACRSPRRCLGNSRRSPCLARLARAHGPHWIWRWQPAFGRVPRRGPAARAVRAADPRVSRRTQAIPRRPSSSRRPPSPVMCPRCRVARTIRAAGSAARSAALAPASRCARCTAAATPARSW